VDGPTEGASPSLDVLTQRAGHSLRQGSADHDSHGIAGAVALFEQVADRARRDGNPDYPAALMNLANAPGAGRGMRFGWRSR
jgi:hypothetical protein